MGEGNKCFQVTFPDRENIPARSLQGLKVFLISLPISVEFSAPIFAVSLGEAIATSAVMTMPKAPVYENDLAPPGKDNIGFARQTGGVETIPIAIRVEQPTDG